MWVGLAGLAGLLICVPAGGCGTVCNLAGGVVHPDEEPKVYGGLERDGALIGSLLAPNANGSYGSGMPQPVAPPTVAHALPDGQPFLPPGQPTFGKTPSHAWTNDMPRPFARAAQTRPMVLPDQRRYFPLFIFCRARGKEFIRVLRATRECPRTADPPAREIGATGPLLQSEEDSSPRRTVARRCRKPRNARTKTTSLGATSRLSLFGGQRCLPRVPRRVVTPI